jgi:uncharacterized protein
MLDFDCTPSGEMTLRRGATYLPKDFVETHDGLIFAVVREGIEHQRIIAFLRSFRESDTLHKLDSRAAHALLATQHGDWLFHSPSLDIQVHGVPIPAIARHYCPSAFWQAVRRQTDCRLAQLYQTLVAFAEDESVTDCMGVTGSYLIGANHAQSDIDLVIYGLEKFALVRRAVARAVEAAALQSLTEEQWRFTYSRRGGELTYDEYVWYERRKLNKFSFRGIKVDLSCVAEPHPAQLPAARKLGRCTLVAQVIDDRFSFASPAVYGVQHPQVQWILACTPTYSGEARAGEFVRASGWLEKDSLTGLRLVVGTSREAAGEYLRVLPANLCWL